MKSTQSLQCYDQLLSKIFNCLSLPDKATAIRDSLQWLKTITDSEHLLFMQVESATGDCDLEVVCYIAIGYEQEFLHMYMEREFQQEDPVVRTAYSTTGLVNWEETLEKSTVPVRYAEALTHYTVPQQGYTYSFKVGCDQSSLVSMFSISSNHGAPTDDQIYIIKNLIPAVHVSASALAPVTRNNPLTAREIEVLRWARSGKTVWELSRIFGLSEATIKFHFQNIYRKLNACNRAQAIAKAFQLGLISEDTAESH